MNNFLPIVSRLVGSAIGGVLTYFIVKYQLNVDPHTTEAAAIALGAFVSNVGYAISHKTIDSRANPADAAAPVLVEAGKTAKQRLTPPDSPVVQTRRDDIFSPDDH